MVWVLRLLAGGGWRVAAGGLAVAGFFGAWLYVQNLRDDLRETKENLEDAQSAAEQHKATILREREAQRNLIDRLDSIEKARKQEGPGGCLSQELPPALLETNE